MFLTVAISPHGHLIAETPAQFADGAIEGAVAERTHAAFSQSAAAGLLHLATVELQTPLPPAWGYLREFARDYLTRLCHTPQTEGMGSEPLAAPPAEELGFRALQSPPIKGLEYLNAEAMGEWWRQLDELVRGQIAACPGGAQAWLQQKSPLWRMVGRVTFHLAENKRNPELPFAFLATYASRLSAQARLQHQPLGRALQEYAGAKNRKMLLALLLPIQRASERSELVRKLVESGDVYHPLSWTPSQAFRFLQEIPAMEEAGIIVRVPDWWRARRPPRPTVSVTVGNQKKSALDAGAMLDFDVRVTLEDETLSPEEVRALLDSSSGLALLKGKWVEIDREKLAEAIAHWKAVQRDARDGAISFHDAMRLLSGVNMNPAEAQAAAARDAQWTGIRPGAWLDEVLRQMRQPQEHADGEPPGLLAELRPYQKTGTHWLWFLAQLGLGACLADDMGLGKTIQVLSLLLKLRSQRKSEKDRPSLLVVPASLIGNWKAEIARFAPSLSVWIAHPSETDALLDGESDEALSGRDLVITSYGMLARQPWLQQRPWRLAILDEAQAIKNSGTRQTRAVKELKADARIALTGTPIENRLSDLWSLFDFLNPGLLGSGTAFGRFAKGLAQQGANAYGPLRMLVQPYILRRLKTDKRVIADLPDKTEVQAFCPLSRRQAVLYEQAVDELRNQLETAEGIQRRGLVLAYLMRLKQICNHPSQWLADGGWAEADSGKFGRLRELCEELAERQEKVLVFTQFREMTEPLAGFLGGVFGRPGLVLHGQTPVGRRRELVETFQREDGPPYFVLSIKAGGTGLNLTEASHVIHFDRWWNPAVENQATDRAFRIGQKKNVLVHKFVCRGTVEEKIDQLIAGKVGLARDLLEGGAEKLLTEMDNSELLRLVSLDIHRAEEP